MKKEMENYMNKKGHEKEMKNIKHENFVSDAKNGQLEKRETEHGGIKIKKSAQFGEVRKTGYLKSAKGVNPDRNQNRKRKKNGEETKK